MSTLITVLTALGTLLAAVGAKELIQRWVTRRGDRADALVAERKQVSATEAAGNLDVLRVLLTETKDRVDSYERSITELKTSHAADIRELKTENRTLERAVADLRLSLQEYQLGNRVPRGMVLMPAPEVKRIREVQPGLLLQRWYPGELEAGGDPGQAHAEGPTIVARVTRLDGGPGGGA